MAAEGPYRGATGSQVSDLWPHGGPAVKIDIGIVVPENMVATRSVPALGNAGTPGPEIEPTGS